MTTSGLCDLRLVLEGRGYRFQRDGKFVENPTRTERTASIHVRKDKPHRWNDFGSSEGGDLVDFLQVAEGMTKDAAIREAASILGVTANARPDTSQKMDRQASERRRARPNPSRYAKPARPERGARAS